MNRSKWELEYWKNGWAVVESVYDRTEADAIAALAVDVAQAELDQADDEDAEVDVDESGRPLPRKVNYPFLKDERFRAFILDDRLLSRIGEILGGEPRLVFDQIFLKPPRHGSAKPYHQDNAYFQCSPPDKVLTAWIALDDVDESNGCLRYIEGSHRMPILEHHAIEGERYNITPDDSEIDYQREAPAPVPKGGVIFHHGQTLHTSHANPSDRWRRAYASHWVTDEVTCEIDTLERAFFRCYPELF